MPASYKAGPAMGEPLSQMNTTPLIDVLLVLLIMMIISIPIAAHKVEVNLPIPGPDSGEEQVDVSLIVEQNGAILWNGDVVSKAQLEQLLTRAASAETKHVIRFEPNANASYNDAVQVINMVSDAEIKAFAFAGNYKYRQFDLN